MLLHCAIVVHCGMDHRHLADAFARSVAIDFLDLGNRDRFMK
ncbi:MAG: hypothetical protein ACI91V_000208 [Lentimonas sp.]|jgi:hypothetical protein